MRVFIALLSILAVNLAIFGQDDQRRLTRGQQAERRRKIRQALFVPDPLPPLAAETHGMFEPMTGVIAQRVSYRTQLGLRVPAILYLPKDNQGKLPALVIVNGHGGDKYSWYAFYSGLLYARAGAAVLTYDPIGEGERHREKNSGTRAHDKLQEPAEMGRRMGGLMVTDVMQAVSYLRSRPEVDGARIAACGYSMGSFVLALAAALDERLHAAVLVGGGNLDGGGEYWDKSKPMCQALPYQSLSFLGDRAAAIYALHAARGPTLIFNGAADTVVAMPTHGEAFFHDLRRRTAAHAPGEATVFDFRLVEGVSHRPFFVTKDVALWLEEKLDFPHWTRGDIAAMPATHIGTWAAKNGVAMDRGYTAEDREGGTPALGSQIPGLTREQLSVFAHDEWLRRREELVYESWVAKARQAMESPSAKGVRGPVARNYTRQTIYHSPQTPGYTCWTGIWTMPDRSLMATFKEATGPLEGRPRAPEQLQRIGAAAKDPQRDFTGLKLANVYLRSADGGKSWTKVAEDIFPGPMDRASWGGSHLALADGSILRATDGSQLPLVEKLPRRIFFERSADFGQTWKEHSLPPEPRRPVADYLGDFGDCISRVKRLADGTLLATGVIRPDSQRRLVGEPLVMLSSDEGKTWQPQTIELPERARDAGAWNEWDAAELAGGNLVCVFRRLEPTGAAGAGSRSQVRWQGVLRKRAGGWALTDYQPAPFPHSGHPELLATREHVVFHIATTGIHWTGDAGQTWHALAFVEEKEPYRSRYYPRAVQLGDGTICVVSHRGSDNAYGQVDQAIVLDRFRLEVVH